MGKSISSSYSRSHAISIMETPAFDRVKLVKTKEKRRPPGGKLKTPLSGLKPQRYKTFFEEEVLLKPDWLQPGGCLK